MKSKVLFGLLIFLILIFIGFYLFHNTNPFSKFKDTQFYSYNNYEQAIGLATINVDEALNLCSKTDKMRDECFTNIVKLISEKDYEKGLKICEEITEPKWKSECFFVVAESLFNKNLSLATKICEESKMFEEACYSHLILFLTEAYNISSIMPLCNLPCNSIRTIDFKRDCFRNFGCYVTKQYDTNIAVSACEEVPIEFRNDCLGGVNEATN